jgi:stage IV sporulation protein FB
MSGGETMRLGKVFGVTVKLSPYLLMLLALYIGLGIWPQAIAIFLLVFMHEWAHIFTAKGYGLDVEAVELLPFGGVATLGARFEVDPVVETLVALAGPVANLILAMFGLVLDRTGWLNSELVAFFIRANLTVALFNLTPALPLDGGRILRAWLSTKQGYRKATKNAATAGKIVGVLLTLIGLACLLLKYTDFTPAVVGVFLFIASGKEEKEAQFVFVRYLNRKQEELTKLGILRIKPVAVRPEIPLKTVVRTFLPQSFNTVHLIDEDFKISATYTETEVIRALFEKGIDFPIGKLNEKL